MLHATLYVFSKRDNSTKQPDNSVPHLEVHININDGNSSLIAPQIRLTPISNVTFTIYNYVLIAEFGRLYYISNWLYNADGSWTAICTVDVLASWKAYILVARGYIGRTSNAQYKNSNVIDNLYPPMPLSTDVIKEDYNSYLTSSISGQTHGTYIIGIVSHANPTVGATVYYEVRLTELAKLIKTFTKTDTTVWDGVTEMTADVLKCMVNPIQFITSCKWFPVPTAPITSTERINVWGWDSGADGYRLSDEPYFSWPPDFTSIGQRNYQYLDLPTWTNPDEYPYSPPYAEYAIITPWGTFDLDGFIMAKIYQQNSATKHIRYRVIINYISGTATLIVEGEYTENGTNKTYEFFRREVNIAIDLPLAQVSLDYLSMAKSTITATGKASNPFGWFNAGEHGAAIANNMLDALAATLSPSVQSTGGATSVFTPLIETITLQIRRLKRVTPDNNFFGYPCKLPVSAINTIQTTGYIQMDEIQFAAPCTDTETEMVTKAAKEGIYLE